MSSGHGQRKSVAALKYPAFGVSALLAAATVFLGTQLLTASNEDVPDRAGTEPAFVRTEAVRLEDGFDLKAEFIGQIEPAQKTDIAFEIGGKVREILVEEGERVEKGQILARLDLADLENQVAVLTAARKALEAKKELAELTVKRAGALKERGFTSQVTLDQAQFELAELKARLAEVDAQIEGVELNVEKASVRAPFEAIVGARVVDTGTIVGPRQAVLTLHQSDITHMRVGVPPGLAGRLTLGDRVDVAVEGRTFKGRILSLRPDLDQSTYTRTVIVALTDGTLGDGILFGQTGRVIFRTRVPGRGFWVPLTALSEGVRGLWALNVVSKDDALPVIRSEAVEIVHLRRDQAFVIGTVREGDAVVVSGQHRIVSGQSVRLAAK